MRGGVKLPFFSQALGEKNGANWMIILGERKEGMDSISLLRYNVTALYREDGVSL
jgi:hypothetical protein